MGRGDLEVKFKHGFGVPSAYRNVSLPSIFNLQFGCLNDGLIWHAIDTINRQLCECDHVIRYYLFMYLINV